MSRLSPEKGLDFLIPLWAKLCRSDAHKDSLLVIAGPDYRGYQRTVEKMIGEYGLRSDVLLTGMIRGPRKAALLKRASVFLLPSYTENFGIVVAEALACGVPVVTTTGTPWRQLETVGAGRCVPPAEDEFGDALRELLNMSAPQRRTMGDRGRTFILENYTWDRVCDKFLTVCDCILRGKEIPRCP